MKSNLYRVEIPFINVNDRSVILQEWLVREGDRVRYDQVICILETSKATLEVAAGKTGFVKGIRFQVGEEVPVNTILCYIVDDMSLEIPVETSIRASEGMKDSLAEAQREGQSERPIPKKLEGRITRRAWNLVVKHDVDITRLKPKGFIREFDVLALISPVADVSAKTGFRPAFSEQFAAGRLHQLSELIRDDPGYKSMGSALKTYLYRAFGAEIGADFEIGAGSQLLASSISAGRQVVIAENVVIEAKRIILADGVRIDEGVRIRAESLNIGQGTVLQENCRVSCRGPAYFGDQVVVREGLDCECEDLFVGSETFFARYVIIGRGGSREPTARITVGERNFLGERSMLNACMPIRIGNDSFLGQNSIIMTHNIGHSYLDGYENAFQPVSIGQKVQIGINCVLYPGTMIEDGAIVGSNSYVIGRVPMGKMVLGVPARVIKEAHRDLQPGEKVERFFELADRFRQLLEARSIPLKEKRQAGEVSYYFVYDNAAYSVAFRRDSNVGSPPTDTLNIIIALESSSFPNHENVVWFNLQDNTVTGVSNPVSEGVREFLRKAGIKMSPWPWRYQGGIL